MSVQARMLEPGKKLHWGDHDPDDTGKLSKDDAQEHLDKYLERRADLQERLYDSGSNALLIVLQGMDTAGKDGVVEHVAGAFNPQGVQVSSFKVPTPEEASHDFLWRIHKAVPHRGMVGIFNRSHYEEVLVVRVAKLKPKSEWSKHFDHINAFEKLLSESGVKIVKFFLHISADEQKRRLEERIATPEKQWKISPSDLEVRKQWYEYVDAYQDALEKCTTEWAPWYVVPANHKWYRNLAISGTLVKVLEDLKLEYPTAAEGVGSLVVPPAG